MLGAARGPGPPGAQSTSCSTQQANRGPSQLWPHRPAVLPTYRPLPRLDSDLQEDRDQVGSGTHGSPSLTDHQQLPPTCLQKGVYTHELPGVPHCPVHGPILQIGKMEAHAPACPCAQFRAWLSEALKTEIRNLGFGI